MEASSSPQAVYAEEMPVHGSGPFQAKRSFTPDPHITLLMPVKRAFLAATICAFLGCSNQPDMVKAELFPETQQPHFKTCAARLGGTYKERELQRHLVVDIYKEPAPDQGPITDECITRE